MKSKQKVVGKLGAFLGIGVKPSMSSTTKDLMEVIL
jgi:hypothetical protein